MLVCQILPYGRGRTAVTKIFLKLHTAFGIFMCRYEKLGENIQLFQCYVTEAYLSIFLYLGDVPIIRLSSG